MANMSQLAESLRNNPKDETAVTLTATLLGLVGALSQPEAEEIESKMLHVLTHARPEYGQAEYTPVVKECAGKVLVAVRQVHKAGS